jgi:hypothetical protein
VLLRPPLRIGAVIRRGIPALFVTGLSACATLGPKEHEDLRALGMCGGTPRVQENVARVMRQYRLTMPDTVLALELVVARLNAHVLLPSEGNFLIETGVVRTTDAMGILFGGSPLDGVNINDLDRLASIRRCLATRYGYRFAVER